VTSSGGFENTALNTELLDVEEGKQTKRRKQEKEPIGEPPIYIYIYIMTNFNLLTGCYLTVADLHS